MTDSKRDEPPVLPFPPISDDQPLDVHEAMLLAETRRLLGFPVEQPVLGRYELIRTLGRGGTGVVYAARDRVSAKDIALKVFLCQADAIGAETLEGARADIAIMTQISHPCVVAVHEFGVIDGHVFLAMELVRGRSLREWRRHPAPYFRAIVGLYVQIAGGLSAAHRLGLVHGDFKPDNVLVPSDIVIPEPPKIVDFGIAARLGDPIRAGTQEYMAPEQFADQQATFLSDQYGFCVSLFEQLFGYHPYVGCSLQEFREIIARRRPGIGTREVRRLYIELILENVSRGEVIWPENPEVPSSLREILARGLSGTPRRRFPGLDSLAIALEGSRQNLLEWHGSPLS